MLKKNASSMRQKKNKCTVAESSGQWLKSLPDASGATHSSCGTQPLEPVEYEEVHSPESSCDTSSDIHVVPSSSIQDRIDPEFYSMDKYSKCTRNAASLKPPSFLQKYPERNLGPPSMLIS